MTKDTTIVIGKQLFPIVTQAINVIITDKTTLTLATELLSKLNQFNDKITEEKERVTKPLNEALKAERSRWKPLESQYTQAIDHLRTQMSEYQTAEVKRQREEEAKIASRIAPGKGKLSLETATKKLEAVEKPDKEVATEAGLVQFREVKRFEVVDMKVLPIEYHLPDEKMIQALMKDGKELPGVRYFTEQVPVNYR